MPVSLNKAAIAYNIGFEKTYFPYKFMDSRPRRGSGSFEKITYIGPKPNINYYNE